MHFLFFTTLKNVASSNRVGHKIRKLSNKNSNRDSSKAISAITQDASAENVAAAMLNDDNRKSHQCVPDNEVGNKTNEGSLNIGSAKTIKCKFFFTLTYKNPPTSNKLDNKASNQYHKLSSEPTKKGRILVKKTITNPDTDNYPLKTELDIDKVLLAGSDNNSSSKTKNVVSTNGENFAEIDAENVLLANIGKYDASKSIDICSTSVINDKNLDAGDVPLTSVEKNASSNATNITLTSFDKDPLSDVNTISKNKFKHLAPVNTDNSVLVKSNNVSAMDSNNTSSKNSLEPIHCQFDARKQAELNCIEECVSYRIDFEEMNKYIFIKEFDELILDIFHIPYKNEVSEGMFKEQTNTGIKKSNNLIEKPAKSEVENSGTTTKSNESKSRNAFSKFKMTFRDKKTNLAKKINDLSKGTTESAREVTGSENKKKNLEVGEFDTEGNAKTLDKIKTDTKEEIKGVELEPSDRKAEVTGYDEKSNHLGPDSTTFNKKSANLGVEAISSEVYFTVVLRFLKKVTDSENTKFLACREEIKETIAKLIENYRKLYRTEIVCAADLEEPKNAEFIIRFRRDVFRLIKRFLKIKINQGLTELEQRNSLSSIEVGN